MNHFPNFVNLVCGGVQRGVNYVYHFLDSMEVYNCRDDSWTLLTSSLPVCTYGIHLKLHGHMLYMFTLPRKNTKDWGFDDVTGVEAWCIDIDIENDVMDFSFTKIHQDDIEHLQELFLF
jgi:N-acetylneuraminic acid mutarotase